MILSVHRVASTSAFSIKPRRSSKHGGVFAQLHDNGKRRAFFDQGNSNNIGCLAFGLNRCCEVVFRRIRHHCCLIRVCMTPRHVDLQIETDAHELRLRLRVTSGFIHRAIHSSCVVHIARGLFSENLHARTSISTTSCHTPTMK